MEKYTPLLFMKCIQPSQKFEGMPMYRMIVRFMLEVL
jgi:hypothetical protein